MAKGQNKQGNKQPNDDKRNPQPGQPKPGQNQAACRAPIRRRTAAG
jgi:hypothetical protein